MAENEKIAGILGGMGPEATLDLLQRIIRLTPALDDVDHVRCIVDNNPKIPSRIKAIIEGTGEDPGPCLVGMARGLESWGADFLAIACNTAHTYYDLVSNAVKIPVINLVDLVVSHVKQTRPDCRKIGILASTAVRMTGLYEKPLQGAGIQLVYPDPDFQKRLLEVIQAIKAGGLSEEGLQTYKEICENLKGSGAVSVIIGCTELSGIHCSLPFEIIDATDLLARQIVAVAKS